ncbi:hypothetical protein ACWEVP_31615 [Amycolatopsis sp. NPDC003865]
MHELDGMALPKFAPSAADSITDADHARKVLTAYYNPEITHAGDPKLCPGREVRIRGRIHLVVDRGTIISVGEYDPPKLDGASPVLDPQRARLRRFRGGRGNRFPTTVDELVRRIRATGAEIEQTSKHYSVRLPSGKWMTVPKTVHDWRALRNTVTQLRRAGLDVTRDV